jgi:hypothetical protein
MHLFLSYAGEHRATADALALRLRQGGHDVFYDRDDLPPGQSFDDRIREALKDCDGLVYLVSPESVAPGAYTLTELEFARERWPNPSGRVLPVMVVPTPYGAIPEYLKAVTVLEPKGNVVAETAAAASRLGGARRLPRWTLVTAALGLTLAAAYGGWRFVRPAPGPPAHARGSVTDVTTGAPVPGASVEVRCGARAVADGVSDQTGAFDLAFASCREPAAVHVGHADYVERSQAVSAGGAAPIALLPRGLGRCVLTDARGIVVGRFRPPLSGGSTPGDLTARIAEALNFDVGTVIQALNLRPELQPRFVACDQADPRSLEFDGYARALGADALLVGSVELADGAYKVRTLVGDAFRLFRPPQSSLTPAVALGDPPEARLAGEMHGAVLTAVARGYAERRMFPECVDVAVAAERLVGRTSWLEQTLTRCQKETGIPALGGGA